MIMTVPYPSINLKPNLDKIYLHFVHLCAAAKVTKKGRFRYNATLSEFGSRFDLESTDLAIPRLHIRSLAFEELQKGLGE